MIAKLMKYDLKKMLRVLVYIYIVSISLAGITRLINIGRDIQAIAILGYVFSGLTYSAIGSILVNTFVHILRTFIVGFYKDESYLTHTLPVSKNKLLLSKYLSGLIVIITSVVVCFLSLFILFYSPELMELIKSFLNVSISGLNMSVGLFIALLILIIFAQICAIMSMCFTAVVKANTYNSKRVIKGLIWFAIFYFGATIVSIIAMVITFAIGGNLTELAATKLSQSAFTTILVLGLIVYMIYSVVFYFWCNKLFNKGVNVD